PALLVAEQVRVAPLMSVLVVVVPHPEEVEMPVSGSLTLQLTVTSLVYQPLEPLGLAGVTVGVMTCAVLSQSISRTGKFLLFVAEPPSVARYCAVCCDADLSTESLIRHPLFATVPLM